MSPEDRNQQLQQLKSELAREQAAVSSGTRPDNPGRIREIRKTIARILTINHEKPVAAKPKAAAKAAKTTDKEVQQK